MKNNLTAKMLTKITNFFLRPHIPVIRIRGNIDESK